MLGFGEEGNTFIHGLKPASLELTLSSLSQARRIGGQLRASPRLLGSAFSPWHSNLLELRSKGSSGASTPEGVTSFSMLKNRLNVFTHCIFALRGALTPPVVWLYTSPWRFYMSPPAWRVAGLSLCYSDESTRRRRARTRKRPGAKGTLLPTHLSEEAPSNLIYFFGSATPVSYSRKVSS